MSSYRLKMTDGFDLKRILTGNYPEYSSPISFVQGTFRTHGGKLYCSNTDIVTPEEWTSDHWTEVPRTVPDGTSDYSSSSSYAVGDFCRYNGALYVCKTAIGSGGETWTSGHWTAMPDVSSLFSGANTSNNLDNIRVSTADATTAKEFINYKKVTDAAANHTVYVYTVNSASPTITIPSVGSGISDFEVWMDATNYATDYEATFSGATILYKDGKPLTFEKSAVTVVHFTACQGIGYTAVSSVFKSV